MVIELVRRNETGCDQNHLAGMTGSMLADICNQFTEGFDTADLRGAKALLDQLSG